MAEEADFAGYLQYLTLDTTVVFINGQEQYSIPLPRSLKEQEFTDLVYQYCQKYNLDYVSTENVEKLTREIINEHRKQRAAPKQDKEPVLSKAQEALELAKERCFEFFVDQHGTSYAAVTVKGHVETLALSSTRFRNWLARAYYDEKEGLLNGEDINNALSVLKAEAEFGENRRQMHLRVASADADTIWYDLTNPLWQAVKITAEGWTIEDAPVMFMRYNNQQPQTHPSGTYPEDIFERFFGLTNVKTPEDKLLLKCYLIALFWPGIPKPVLMLHGEQGAAKSTLQELIKELVDPSSVKSLSFPRDINELVQKLSHNYVAFFDNVSHIKDWISDELCKAVTGSGFSKRQLYTNDDDVIYNFMRCIGFNGINLGANKADLLDRGLIIQLERIPKEKRRKIKRIWAEFQEIKPQLLGYIFDILSNALQARQKGGIELKELPRMADFAEIAEIISRSMGHPEGAFLAAYYRNIGLQTTEAIEANPIAQCISTFIDRHEGPEWTGTTSALLEELEKIAAELKINTRAEGWPKAPNSLSRRLNEVVTNLREVGIVIERYVEDSHKNVRLVRIRKISPQPPQQPQDAEQAPNTLPYCGDISGDKDSKNTEPPQISPQANQARCDDCGDCGDNVHTFCCPYCKQPFATKEEVLSHGVIVHPGRPIAADLGEASKN